MLPQIELMSRTPLGRQSMLQPNTQRDMAKSAFGSLGKIRKKVGKIIKNKRNELKGHLNMTADFSNGEVGNQTTRDNYGGSSSLRALPPLGRKKTNLKIDTGLENN